jgi:hypothetical protein
MGSVLRRLKHLWWFSGVITEFPSTIKGGKPVQIVPTAVLTNGEVKMTYEVKQRSYDNE